MDIFGAPTRHVGFQEGQGIGVPLYRIYLAPVGDQSCFHRDGPGAGVPDHAVLPETQRVEAYRANFPFGDLAFVGPALLEGVVGQSQRPAQARQVLNHSTP